MFIPQNHNASQRLVDTFGTYLASRLKANAETRSLYETFQKAQETLDASNALQRKSRRGMLEAQSARDHAAFLMGRVIAKFQLAVLAHVEKVRTSPLYGRYFKDGMEAIALVPPHRLVENVKTFERDLAMSADAEALRSWVPVLVEGRMTLEKSMVEYSDARIVYTNAVNAEETERLHWVEAYRTVAGDLVGIYPADRRKIESFFRKGRKPRGGTTPTEAATSDETKVIGPPTAGETRIAM